jgi:hypothetical protein
MVTRRSLMLMSAAAVIAASPLPNALAQGAEETAATRGDAPRRLRLAVIDFKQSASFRDVALGNLAANAIENRLSRTARFDMYARRQMEQLMQQLRIDASGAVDPTSAKELGKQSGVDYLITGDVTAASLERRNRMGTAEVTIHFKAIHLETGRIWKQGEYKESESSFSLNGRVEPKELMAKALDSCAGKFARCVLPDIDADVIHVKAAEKLFIINRGSENGIGVGMFFNIVEQGEPIRDPKTGEVLDYEKKEICMARVKSVQGRIAYLEPGEYSRNPLGKVRFSVREKLLGSIKQGQKAEEAESREKEGFSL